MPGLQLEDFHFPRATCAQNCHVATKNLCFSAVRHANACTDGLVTDGMAVC